MAESVVLVCDVCGVPAEEGVIIRAGGRNYAKDLCSTHLRELLTGTRTPKRGRRLGSGAKQGPGRPKGSTTTRRSRAKTAGATGNGRRKKRRRSSAKTAA